MTDIELTRSDDGVHVQGLTDEGIEFVDEYPIVYFALDVGRIIVPKDEADALLEQIREQSLTVRDDR